MERAGIGKIVGRKVDNEGKWSNRMVVKNW